jgi:hypothetical protein
MNAPGELSVSFIQIGDDHGATKFLHHLDDHLNSDGARFGISLPPLPLSSPLSFPLSSPRCETLIL